MVVTSDGLPRLLADSVSASSCLAHLFLPSELLLIDSTSPKLGSYCFSKPELINLPDSKGTVSSVMLILEEVQLQGGRMPPPTLGCFVLLIFCVASFFLTFSVNHGSACPLVDIWDITYQKPRIPVEGMFLGWISKS